MPDISDVFEYLLEIERRAKQQAAGLPIAERIQQTWTGIGFRLGESYCVVRLGEIREILTYPTLTKVPTVKRWVKGIANIRGLLLPVIDLQKYLGGNNTQIGARCRVLVTNDLEIYIGLLVDEVLGVKHFVEEEHSGEEGNNVDAWLAPYIEDAFIQADDQWHVFNMRVFLDSPALLQVSD